MTPPTPLAILVLPPVGWAIAALWGGLWGSFFNVCIYRIGLYESVTRPRSRCPGCGNPVRAIDNVPILSWLILRGRCHFCGMSISFRYPLVELLTLLLALAIYYRFVYSLNLDPENTPALVNATAHFLVCFAFVGTLIVLSGIDLDHMLLPDQLTYPAIPLFFVAAILLQDHSLQELSIGLVVGYSVVALIAEGIYLLFKREGMGYGDAKLLMLVGGFCGWPAVPFSLFLGGLLGSICLLPVMALRRQKMIGVEIPFGPFLAAAAVIYLLEADTIQFWMG